MKAWRSPFFGHFLLMGKVATPASGSCLTNSQTETLPMAQGKTSPDFRCDRSNTRKRPRAADSLVTFFWPRKWHPRTGAATGTKTERSAAVQKSVSLRSSKPKGIQRRSAAEKGSRGLPPAREQGNRPGGKGRACACRPGKGQADRKSVV